MENDKRQSMNFRATSFFFFFLRMDFYTDFNFVYWGILVF